MTSLKTEDLQHHLEVQQLAYRCCEEIGAGLTAGITEKQAARQMREWLLDHGVDDWLHIPFAWFGDRTAFRGFWNPLQFLPSNRRLEEGDAFILDVAPVVDGYMADIGYANHFGENDTFDKIFTDLAKFRPFNLDRVKAGRPLAEIWSDVDVLIKDLGYKNCHNVYPGHVLAHTVMRVQQQRPRIIAGAFGIRFLETIGRELVTERMKSRSPLWNAGKFSNHPAYPAMWAVEPHIGLGKVGVKFEEIMVVTDDDAFWLDPEPSHVQRWRAMGIDA
jgi:Xaa-Pro aminopeptidase